MASRSFGSQSPQIPHLVSGKEVGDLRNDIEAAFTALEALTSFPKISRVTGGASVSLAAVPVAKALTGESFLQGQVKATLTKGTGTASLAFTANRPGTPGNSITVAIVQGGAGASVAAVGNAITITLALAGSTANAIKALLDADAGCHGLVQTVSGGAGTVLVSAAAPLTGGVGAGLEVFANGLSQAIRGAVTEQAIPLVVSDLTGAANGDAAVLQVKSNGVHSYPVTIDIVT